MTETKDRKLICESCGADFSCGAESGKCWCFAVDLTGETLSELRKEFEDCLCQDCLNTLRIGRISNRTK